MNGDELLWPQHATPADLDAIEAVPLAQRGLPATTYETLTRAATHWPDRNALRVLPSAAHWQTVHERTFAQLLTDVHRVANLLHDKGIRRTDAVAIMSPNCDDMITGLLAAQLAGAAMPINPALDFHHVANLLQRAGARTLIAASDELDTHCRSTAQRLIDAGLLDTVYLLRRVSEEDARSDPKSNYLLRAARKYSGTTFDGDVPTGSDIAALFHTGGTTGLPKLAAHTHANEVTNAWLLALDPAFAATAPLFGALPLFHVNALIVTTLLPLLRGQLTVWAGPLGYRDPELYPRFWSIVEHHQIAVMSAVPTVYGALASQPVDADISSLQLAVVGAAPLPAAVRQEFEKRTGVRLVEGYGLTEATCASTRSFPDHPRPGSVGQRLPYHAVEAIDIDVNGHWSQRISAGAARLVMSGPCIFPGYVIGRGESGFILDGMGKLCAGRLDTEDLGWVDETQFVHLAGRAKDLIIRGGHNIDPAEIESALLEHPDVTAAAAVGRPDQRSGEVPVAYIVVRQGADATADDVLGWARRRIGQRAAIPKSVTSITAMPLTSLGKIHKNTLRARAIHEELARVLADEIAETQIVVDPDTLRVVVYTSASTDPSTLEATLRTYPISVEVRRKSARA